MTELIKQKIIGLHIAVTTNVSHNKRLASGRYFVWEEDEPADMHADGKHAERAVRIYSHLFTRTEFDPWADAFEESLNGAEGVAWRSEGVQYEDETGLYNYSWEIVVYG